VGQLRATRVQLDPNTIRNPYGKPMIIGVNGEYPKEFPVVVLQDSITLANVAGIFRDDKKAFTVRPEGSTTFADLQKGPVVLLGAFDNDWTMRVTESMRFHFNLDADKHKWWIADRQKPDEEIGMLRMAVERTTTSDYAIVARLFDPLTRQPTMVIAGVSPYGTHAAAEFLINPQYLDEFSKKAPHDWQTKNMELLIYTNIVDNEAGPPRVVASYFW
jgi:hypothetical protein